MKIDGRPPQARPPIIGVIHSRTMEASPPRSRTYRRFDSIAGFVVNPAAGWVVEMKMDAQCLRLPLRAERSTYVISWNGYFRCTFRNRMREATTSP